MVWGGFYVRVILNVVNDLLVSLCWTRAVLFFLLRRGFDTFFSQPKKYPKRPRRNSSFTRLDVLHIDYEAPTNPEGPMVGALALFPYRYVSISSEVVFRQLSLCHCVIVSFCHSVIALAL